MRNRQTHTYTQHTGKCDVLTHTHTHTHGHTTAAATNLAKFS